MSTTLEDAINWARHAGGGEGEVDEAAAREAIEKAKESMAQVNAAAEQASAEALERSEDNAKKQAIFDAVYAVAAADGSVDPVEQAKIVIGLGAMLGAEYDENTIQGALVTAQQLFDAEGVEAIAGAAAVAVPEREGRSALLVLASAVAWLGRGVGTKEGLALQALARAFEIDIHDLHRLMAVGKVA